MIRIGDYHDEYQERKNALKALFNVIKEQMGNQDWYEMVKNQAEFKAYAEIKEKIKENKFQEKDQDMIYLFEEARKIIWTFVLERAFQKIENLALCSTDISRILSPVLKKNPENLGCVHSGLKYIEEILSNNLKEKEKYKEKHKDYDILILRKIVDDSKYAGNEKSFEALIAKMKENGTIVDEVLIEKYKKDIHNISYFSEEKVFDIIANKIFNIFQKMNELGDNTVSVDVNSFDKI